jgi:aminocarboxymuconate-semialdehyde decarboxylase
MTVVDVHSHFFPRRVQVSSGAAWPRVQIDGADGTTGTIMVGDRPFRTVRSGLWEVGARLAELDMLGVERQLLSPVPVVLDAQADPGYFRSISEGIAEAVAMAPDRFAGLGAVSWADTALAVEELRYVVRDLGLLGIEIGCRVGDRELDDAELRPLFTAAEELGALVFVHPLGGGGEVVRRSGEQPYDFGLGMLTDTAIAATALVFGGVLDACPRLEVLLAHGGGTLPWAFPRLVTGTALGGDRSSGDHAGLLRRLWADTLVFAPEHLGLLAQRFGAGHVAFGSDYPFIPGELAGARRLIDAAVVAGQLTADEGHGLLRDNATGLMDALGARTARRG